ncbi:MAG: hypothetical protein IT379_16535 [Deltaproteobacteria bacterium]|nr:hypothetical protein [Deltaproteobacteria bacterium]
MSRTLAIACGPVALAVIALAACDLPPDDPARDPGPPALLASFPERDAVDVPRRLVLRFELDRQLDPRSVSRNTVALVSGDGAVLLTTRYDIVDSAIEARAFRGGPLVADVRYRAVVDAIRGASGGELEEPITIPFRTATDDNALPPDDAPAAWSEVGPLLAARCGGQGCHGGDRPAMGLRLDTAEGVRETARGVAAIQTAGPREGDISLGVLLGRPALARIEIIGDEGRPEHSYLMLKVTGHEWAHGERMPRGADPLTRDEQRLLQSWIRAGAPTR